MKLTRTFSAAMRSLAERIGVTLADAQPAAVEPVPVPKAKAPPKIKLRKQEELAMSHFNLHTPERQADESMQQYRARQALSRKHVRLITARGI